MRGVTYEKTQTGWLIRYDYVHAGTGATRTYYVSFGPLVDPDVDEVKEWMIANCGARLVPDPSEEFSEAAEFPTYEDAVKAEDYLEACRTIWALTEDDE